jgi:adenylate cyclase
MKKKGLIFIAIGISAILLTVLLYFLKPDALNSIDLKLRDTRFRLRGSLEPDNRVIIVAIDAKSIDELGRWPWKRSVIADLIEGLSQAKAIGLDIVFSEPSDPLSDKKLSRIINNSRNVIAGYYLRDEETTIDNSSLLNLKDSRIKLIKTKGDIVAIPVREYPYGELNISSIKATAGFFNVIPDEDGLYRKANLLLLFQGDLYPSLALQAVRLYKNQPILLELEEYGIASLIIGHEKVPCDESGLLTINYYGKGGTFKTISAVDVIKKRISPDQFKDRIIFIGATEIGISDIRNTPLDPVMPGVEIHATVASNILSGHYLIYNAWVAGLDILFIGLPVLVLVFLISKTQRTVYSLAFFILITTGTYSLNLWLFKTYLFNLSMIYPLSSLLLSYITSEAYRNIVIEKKSRFLKRAFSSYVSPELVNIILRNPDLLRLGGEKRTITVLFSDIRDFTTLSEALEPERLVSLLNNYLDPMTKIVLKHKGMLDKYIGDAIMAIYNAPVDLEDHPQKALLTGLEMLKELKRLNEEFKRKGLPEINIGIGINTGEAITGNMGTEVRFDYTAIGDTVNLASRLEGLNKFYGTRIIISSTTYEGIKSRSDFYMRELDFIRVKGKKEPVRIYEVMEEDSPLIGAGVIKEFEKALHLYRERRFREALEVFRDLENRFNDTASKVFRKRSESFILNPPPDDWDGVYVAKEK